MMSKQYNYCLDFIKGIACVAVVFMHCEFPGILGTVVQTICRFCVPLFFMVSGFYCKEVGIPKKIWHIFRMIVYACLFYAAFTLIRYLLGFNVNWTVNAVGIKNWIIFNQPAWAGVAGQYWFLFALLYDYILFLVVNKLKFNKYAYWVAAFMFFLYIFLAQGLHLMSYHVPNMIYRNWLVEGFAYFMLGHWIHCNKESLNVRNEILLLIVVVSSLLCLGERYFMGRDFGVNIFTIPQVFCLFLFAVNNPFRSKGLIQEIGKRYSMFVYIIHPAVWHSFEDLYDYWRVDDCIFFLYLMPIIVVVVTLLCSGVAYNVNLKIKTE